MEYIRKNINVKRVTLKLVRRQNKNGIKMRKILLNGILFKDLIVLL